jgi:hypothetical protein
MALAAGASFLIFAFFLGKEGLVQSKKFVSASIYYLLILMISLVIGKQ